MDANAVVVWTAGDARIWWACPHCKVEGGISPPVKVDEFLKRLSLFTDEHADCTPKRPKEMIAWRG